MKHGIGIGLLLLAGCAAAPDEADYCRTYGIGTGHPEYAACCNYYFSQQAAFNADAAICGREADKTYPKSLYSQPYSYPARFYGGPGFGFGAGPFSYSRGGYYPRMQMVHVGADYQQIAEIDRLRMGIIAPCMQAQGWNSPADWRLGRHGGVAQPASVPVAPVSAPLPWQK